MASVLIVEDEVILAMDMQFALEVEGHRVMHIATTALEAIEAARSMHPDIVLVDIALRGDLSGVDAARIISRTLPSAKIIFTTGHSSKLVEHNMDGIEHCGVLTKPFDFEELLSFVNRALSSARPPELFS